MTSERLASEVGGIDFINHTRDVVHKKERDAPRLRSYYVDELERSDSPRINLIEAPNWLKSAFRELHKTSNLPTLPSEIPTADKKSPPGVLPAANNDCDKFIHKVAVSTV